MKERGFTLIEVLVVIAILGILMTIILVALQSIRRDAVNARIQSDVRQVRVMAESAYDTDGASYLDWSQSSGVASEVTALLDDIDEALGDPAGAPYMTVIRETQQKDFCVSAPLHAATGGFICVDATGVFRTTTTACVDEPIDGDQLLCPTS